MEQQKAQLVKQREDYVKKIAVLRRELDQLRLQKQDLIGDGHHSSNILKENDKLQVIHVCNIFMKILDLSKICFW